MWLKLITFKKSFNGSMKVYYNTNIEKKHSGGVIAIGNFDGLHLGHQKVINEAKEKAKKKQITFWHNNIRAYTSNVFQP